VLALRPLDNRALDAQNRQAVRQLLRFPMGAPNALVAVAAAAVLPSEALCLRERERLWLHLLYGVGDELVGHAACSCTDGCLAPAQVDAAADGGISGDQYRYGQGRNSLSSAIR
jgi:hypothetical protein